MPLIEVVLRTAATLLLAWLVIVLVRGRRDAQRHFGALCCAAIMALSLSPVAGTGAQGFSLVLLSVQCVAKLALLWLFARCLFDDTFRVRPVHVAAGIGIVLYVVAQQFTPPAPPLLVSLNLALALALGSAALWALVRPAAASRLDAIERQALAALTRALDHEAIYRQEGLTIGRLAAHLRVPEYLLRRVINRGLGFRNFNDFLHSHRIGEACDRLGRRDQEHLPVLTIALDVGYASIGPFNRAFKARMGLTPTAYRRAARDKAAAVAAIPESARLSQEPARRQARAAPG